MCVFLSATILEEKWNSLLKRKRESTEKSDKRGQAKDIKEEDQTIGCSESDGSVFDTPTLTLESLLAKTPAREHIQRTG